MTRNTRLLVETLLQIHERRILATRPGPARDELIAQYKAAAQSFQNARHRRKTCFQKVQRPAGSFGSGGQGHKVAV